MTLSYVILYVPDVAATVAHYERAYGLSQRMMHDSGQYAEMETGATALAFAGEADVSTRGVFEPSRPQKNAAAAEVAFVTDDVAAAYERALAAGASAQSPPATKPWGQTVSYVRDINGFLVEICSKIG
ncbi:MAG: VOC family protein [Nannocystaceae bacterium]|nr:VOC family protein [Nannocystaceae bacterium]